VKDKGTDALLGEMRLTYTLAQLGEWEDEEEEVLTWWGLRALQGEVNTKNYREIRQKTGHKETVRDRA